MTAAVLPADSVHSACRRALELSDTNNDVELKRLKAMYALAGVIVANWNATDEYDRKIAVSAEDFILIASHYRG